MLVLTRKNLTMGLLAIGLKLKIKKLNSYVNLISVTFALQIYSHQFQIWYLNFSKIKCEH